MNRLALLGGALLILLSGCLSIQRIQQADPHTLIHHNWWNHYQRGRLFLKEASFADALKDFEAALGITSVARTTNPTDHWRARTYGMHTLDGYFPHRELGICHFELGHFNRAQAQLELSMQMEPSARAKFYLNRIRTQLASAHTPPVITCDALPTYTAQRTVALSGTVAGANPIRAISINGRDEFIELAADSLNFEIEIPLKEGTNAINIVAEDVSGLKTVQTLSLMADWTPPKIDLQRNGSELELTFHDDLNLQQVQLNQLTEAPAARTHVTSIPINATRALQLAAQDLAGNRTELNLSCSDLQQLAQPTENSPPQLVLTHANQTITLYTPEYALDLRAQDDSALKSIQLNGTNLLPRTTPLYQTLLRIPLTLGTNHLALAAEDIQGNQTSAEITVVYRSPAYLDKQYRLSVSATPIRGESTNPELAPHAFLQMNQELTQEPVRFYLLANRQESKPISEERTLSDSILGDQRARLETGLALDADLLLNTQLLEDGIGQTLCTHVLDADSQKELFIEDVYFEDPLQLARQIQGLILKVEQRFPLIQANLQQRGDSFSMTAGSNEGARSGMKFLVIRSDGPFEQGRILLQNDRPIEVALSTIESDQSRVIIPSAHQQSYPRDGDYLFSR